MRPASCTQAAQYAEMRSRFAGRTFILRYDANDPDWRMRTLAEFSPLSDEAFALRAAPRTTAERAAFNAWAEAEMQRIWEGAP
ncbi:MAG: hypothetical protein NT015_00025 [Alphaproteobacteria bacterium]|nr:hypothetical protein [Alphaproteobacteria bacterium]